MSRRLKYIKKAQGITDKVFAEIIPFIRPGITERQIANKIQKLLKNHGAGLAFKSLVCSGKRTALFHGPASNKKLKQGDPVYLDFGAKYGGFCSDLTRMVFLGEPNKRITKIYEIVKSVQEKQISMVKSGAKVADIDLLGRNILKKSKLAKYFIHSTGHGVGSKIHQKPRISYKSKEVLKTGQVITIEPGVYIPGFGGVRIEDMLVVTNKGYINLTKSAKNLTIL